MKKDAVKLTFSHKVTRDQLIESLDSVLKHYGCLQCGLNGWDGIYLLGDPAPEFSRLKEELFSEKIDTLIDVEHFQAPTQQLGQTAQIGQR